MTTPGQRLLEQLEDQERSSPGPPEEVRERVWDAIENRLGQGPPPPVLDQGPLLAAKAGSSTLVSIVVTLAVVGLVGGGLAWFATRGDVEDEARDVIAAESVPETEPVPREAAEPKPAPPVEPEALLDAQPLAEEEPKDADADEPKSGRSSKRAADSDRREQHEAPTGKTPPAATKTLADELALMQALSTALKQGDSKRALALVAEHERDFAKGKFVEERRAAKARATCQSGKLEAGRALAESFEARWPRSIHQAAVRSDCGL